MWWHAFVAQRGKIPSLMYLAISPEEYFGSLLCSASFSFIFELSSLSSSSSPVIRAFQLNSLSSTLSRSLLHDSTALSASSSCAFNEVYSEVGSSRESIDANSSASPASTSGICQCEGDHVSVLIVTLQREICY